MKNLLLVLTISTFPALLLAQGHGISSYPLSPQKKYVSLEFKGIVSNGSGAGLQARYFQRVLPPLLVSGGFGFSNGERSYQLFADAQYEIYPDFEMQPRVRIKGFVERSEDFDDTHLKIGAAPVFSKGLSFWDQEVFPFVSVPIALDLNNDDASYQVGSQVALGASGKLPFSGTKKLLANFEINLNVQNSYSGLFVGFSHPLD